MEYVFPTTSECLPSITPTFRPTPDGKIFLVSAHRDFYKDNPAPECIFHGILKETGDRVIGYPFHRNFYLVQDNGGVLIVQPNDTPDMILGSLLGRRVEIRGKYVQLDKQAGGGKELLVGYITPI